jgi:urease accessory protein
VIRVEKYFPRSAWQACDQQSPALQLVLPFALRQKSRQQATLDSGEILQLFLPPGTRLRDGDILEAVDGLQILVRAAPEKILFVTASSVPALVRLAYHLGNRHTAIEVGDGFLRLEPDPVLEDLIRRLDGNVETRLEPFEPESGAYGGGHRHHHHNEGEEQALAQQVYHDHEPIKTPLVQRSGD